MARTLSFLCLLASASAAHIKDVDETAQPIVESAPGGASKNFMDVVRDMRSRWRAHKQNQMQTLEPWKVKAYEEKKIKHRGERAEVLRRQAAEAARQQEAVQAEAAAPSPTEKEQAAAELQVAMQAKRDKYGEQFLFTVRDLAGNEYPVRFRTKTHLRVLMNSVTQRYMLTPQESATVHFMVGDKEMKSFDTAEGLGMQNHDVILLTGTAMEKRRDIQEAQAKQDRMKSHLQSKADTARVQQRLQQARQRIQKERKNAEKRQEENTQRRFKEQNLVHLKFNDERGGEVRLGFKRQNWLGGLLSVACKRLGYLPEATHFKVNGTNIIIQPTDTAHSLGLKEDSVITVKVNRKAGPYAAPKVQEPMV